MLKERKRSHHNKEGIFETSIEDGVLIIRILTTTLMDDGITDLIIERTVSLMGDARAVLLDCQESIRHVSSRFLSLLLTLQQQAKMRSADFSLCQLGPEMIEIFKVTSLNKQIPTFINRLDAIECLNAIGRWSIEDTTIDELKETQSWSGPLSQLVRRIRNTVNLFL
jgi:anti-anti-sigma regulatory factor